MRFSFPPRGKCATKSRDFWNKHLLQYAALSMVDRVPGLAISENNPSEYAGNYLNALRLLPNTDVPEVFHVEAEGHKVDPLLTAFRPELCYDYGFSRWF